jgi:hypothetical protein
MSISVVFPTDYSATIMLDEVKEKTAFTFPMAHIRIFIFWQHFELKVQI